MTLRAGWIGLGAMGRPMAARLARTGRPIMIWNRTEQKARELAAEIPEIMVAASLPELAGASEVILVCVSAEIDLETVITDLEPGLRDGQIVVDHSTVAPATARDLAAKLAKRGVGFVDAPITGGVEGAREGRLAVMVGGSEESFERVRPLFDAYARLVHHLGPAGSGQAAKAVNQLIVAGIAEAVCEALALMERLGLPRAPMLELLAGGAAGNWFLDKRGASLLEDRFDSGFDPKLLLKDLKILAGLCTELGFYSSVLNLALADYTALVDSGTDAKDISALYRRKRV